ncbi:thioredoxin family protein [bacterium]|nr:thioredoxin family protein [bacterium]
MTSTILTVSGEQLYVRNRPFKGAVVREGRVTWIDLQSLATALNAQCTPSEGGGFQFSLTPAEPTLVAAGKVAIGGQLLETREIEGKPMISLLDVSSVPGLKVIHNKALGTVDVNFAKPQIAATTAPSESRTKAPAYNPAAGTWLTSYSEAVRQSKEFAKPILMDFTGSDWCGWCQKLKAEVFDTPDFKKWAKENVILLEVDFPRGTPQSAAMKSQNDQLAKKFASSIKGYPTILFTTSDGTVLGKYGYEAGGPSVWTAKAATMLTGE